MRTFRGSPTRPSPRGQAVVLFALILVILIGMAGLAIDGGLFFVHRRQMQNAADAGAHDGTAILAAHYNNVCAYETAARQAAVSGGLANGVVKASSITVGLTDINIENPWYPRPPSTTVPSRRGVTGGTTRTVLATGSMDQFPGTSPTRARRLRSHAGARGSAASPPGLRLAWRSLPMLVRVEFSRVHRRCAWPSRSNRGRQTGSRPACRPIKLRRAVSGCDERTVGAKRQSIRPGRPGRGQ